MTCLCVWNARVCGTMSPPVCYIFWSVTQFVVCARFCSSPTVLGNRPLLSLRYRLTNDYFDDVHLQLIIEIAPNEEEMKTRARDLQRMSRDKLTYATCPYKGHGG
eukprot:sb/3477978/